MKRTAVDPADDFTELLVTVPRETQHFCTMEVSSALRFRKVSSQFSNPQMVLEQARFCRWCGKNSWSPVPVVEEDAK